MLFQSEEMMALNMALKRSMANTFEIVMAAAVVENQTTIRRVIIIINQAVFILDLAQHESLQHSDQTRHHYVHVNDLAKCFYDSEGRPGKQKIEVDVCSLPLTHDGMKCFFKYQ